MFQQEKQPKSINFLEAVYSPTDLWANIYVWLVNIGKWMLIFVQTVALAVFFARFVLDRKNNDLTEEINNKIVVLSNENWKKNAVLFENYQNLLQDVKIVREEQDINSARVSEFLSGIPSSLKLDSFTYNDGKVFFKLLASNLDPVRNYETALKNNPDYYNVRFVITKDKSEIDVRVSFSLFPEEEN